MTQTSTPEMPPAAARPKTAGCCAPKQDAPVKAKAESTPQAETITRSCCCAPKPKGEKK